MQLLHYLWLYRIKCDSNAKARGEYCTSHGGQASPTKLHCTMESQQMRADLAQQRSRGPLALSSFPWACAATLKRM